jgi:hypothetical protein
VPVFGGRGVYESGFPISTAATAFHYVDFADLSGLRKQRAVLEPRPPPLPPLLAAATYRRDSFQSTRALLRDSPESKVFGHLALL